MKIAIEAQRIFRKHKHGMDFVALESIRHLQKIDHENEYFILVKPGEDRCLTSTPNFHIWEISFSIYCLWEQIALPFAVKKIKPDVLHCTSNTAPVWGKTPLVLTLHDIIFLDKKSGSNHSLYQKFGRIYRRWVIPYVIPRCKKIITVSDYEKRRIQQKFTEQKARILRIYNGLNPVFSPERNDRFIQSNYVSTDSYLFFLGNTDPKKNTIGVLKAYAIYLKKSNYKKALLIADLDEKWIDKILKQENIPEIKPFLHVPGYIQNCDLPALYSGAFAFLYPSLRESFGLPLLEAMACGTPVITSATSAIPEIAGEGALLVNPENKKEIAEQLIQLENDPELYKKQVNYGFTRAALFSWEKTAKELLSVYQNIQAK
ncbi:MAG: glycosyltransferase family 1 protein [Massilibacteroides sp.]|nr:glycosyltransferase family 1 protein [Massilibacteroides sp.]